jgi:hypothetical protein
MSRVSGPVGGGQPLPAPSASTLPKVQKVRVFLSYVRENSTTVDRLAAELRDAAIDVWLDRTHLIAGQRWADVIRKSIVDQDFFVACFSSEYAQREQSFMNEELSLAIEQLRRRHRDHRWFIPVRLDESSIIDYPIGGGDTLRSIHFVDLSSEWSAGIQQLLRALVF